MIRLTLKFQHDCPFSRISRAFPESTFAEWTNDQQEYLEFESADQRTVREVGRRLARIKLRGSPLIHLRGATTNLESFALRLSPQYRPVVSKCLDNWSGLILYPIIYRGGWEWYRILALKNAAVPSLMRDLGRRGTVQLIAKSAPRIPTQVDSGSLALDELFGDLTSLQANALIAALEQGYYAVPRRARLATVAQARGEGSSAYQEHVRKAERKLIRALGPALVSYVQRDATPHRRLRRHLA